MSWHNSAAKVRPAATQNGATRRKSDCAVLRGQKINRYPLVINHWTLVIIVGPVGVEGGALGLAAGLVAVVEIARAVELGHFLGA